MCELFVFRMFVVCNNAPSPHARASIVSSLEGGHDGYIHKNTIYGSDGKGSALVTDSRVPNSKGLQTQSCCAI
jgi:hypothetical protein